MGDVMHLKRQTVVERLKRRFDHYRKHQNVCLPKYEQAANGLYETQRQDTLLLKQRYLESKAKKAKSKSDHHRSYKEPTVDTKSQLHSKPPIKRSAEDHPHPTSTPDALNNEDSEKPPKMARPADPDPLLDLPPQQQQQPQQQSSLPPTFSVQQIVQQQQQQFSAKQGSPAATPKDLPPDPVECKQEKEDTDLCQFKQSQASSGGDRLSDTFPSLEFTDEAGENVIPPDILKDLIEDVFTNSDIMKDFNFEDSVGSMKDSEDMDLVKGPRGFQSFVNSPNSQQNGLFPNISSDNDTSIASITPSTLSVTTTSAGFYTGPSPQQRLPSYGSSNMSLSNGLVLDFKMNEPSPAALTLKQMAEQHQNMQQKQQQQQQQQQPMVNTTQLNNRSPAFNQDSFSSHLNNLRPSNFLNGSNPAAQTNSPKLPNTGAMFNTFDFPSNEVINNFSSNCEPVSPNNMFDPDIRSRNSTSMNETNIRGLQMKLSNLEQQQQQQKPPAYNSTRPLAHFSDSAPPAVRNQNLAGNPQQQQPQNTMNRQFQNNSGVRLQIPQIPQLQPRQRNAQQIQQEDPKQQQQQHLMSHSNIYGGYQQAQQSVGSPSFNVTMSQSLPYSNQFTTNAVMSRPPPEYKATAHHHNVASDNLHLVEQLNAPSQVMFNQQSSKSKFAQKQQRPPNVTITPDGTAISSSHEWRTNVLGNQAQQNQFRVSPFSHQDNYGGINSNVPPTATVPLSPIYNQYRMPANQMPNARLSRPNMQQNHLMAQQRQRLAVPQRQRIPSMTGLESHNSIGLNTNSMSPKVMGPLYSDQEISRQDGSHINLDFLDNIESSASDLLNFDHVMPGQHFPILDDMDI